MIDSLYNKHKGKRLAVVGSSPTAFLYDEQEDISIAINGALQLNKRLNYFVTSHPVAYKKSWFLAKKDVTRILNSISAKHCPIFYPDKKLRAQMRKKHNISMKKEFQIDEATGIKYNVLFRGLFVPKKPHLFFYFGDLNVNPLDKFNRKQKEIYAGGTGACASLQIALIMGVKAVHLYGCSFDNIPEEKFKGQNYFYASKIDETGETTHEQKEFMELAIKKLNLEGIKFSLMEKQI